MQLTGAVSGCFQRRDFVLAGGEQEGRNVVDGA